MCPTSFQSLSSSPLPSDLSLAPLLFTLLSTEPHWPTSPHVALISSSAPQTEIPEYGLQGHHGGQSPLTLQPCFFCFPGVRWCQSTQGITNHLQFPWSELWACSCDRKRHLATEHLVQRRSRKANATTSAFLFPMTIQAALQRVWINWLLSRKPS